MVTTAGAAFVSVRSLRITCRDGTVHLSGEVEVLEIRHQLMTLVETFPGIRGVFVGGLRVPNRGHSDSDVQASVQQIIEVVLPDGARTISAQVRSREVILAGIVASHEQMDALITTLSRQPGVREIRNLLQVSPELQEADSATARRLGGALTRLFPDGEIKVKVFGGVVELRGRVSLLSRKRRVGLIAASDGRTVRVINKLQVSGPVFP